MSKEQSSATAKALQAVRGMNDVLPDEASAWHQFEETARDVFERYGYRNLRVPIVEPTPLFVRGIGQHTDVVEHEMYTFEDKLNGESLTLRPEATAGIVRAAIEHNLTYERPQRVWLAGPMFRHERPQKGRYRQFHQLDVEALGYPGPDVDAELILMGRAMWRELGLVEGQHYRLELNTLGQPDERRAHRDALVRHFEQNLELLDEDARRRLHTNPLRILDSKNPSMQPVIEAAPKHLRFDDLAVAAAVRVHAAGIPVDAGEVEQSLSEALLTMYICLCKGLSEATIRNRAREQARTGDASIDNFIASLDLAGEPACGLCALDPGPFIEIAEREWSLMAIARRKDDRAPGLF